MLPPTRRAFLALDTASVGALAGCSSLGSGRSTVVLGGVSLVNTTESAATFDGECVLPSFGWRKFGGELGTTVDRVADVDDPPSGVDCGT